MTTNISKLHEFAKSTNIAVDLDDEKLEEIAKDLIDGYITDQNSREEWERRIDDWMDLALQITQEKSFPWQGAANVKYPLLTLGAMQFQARSYASILGDTDVVKARVIGLDPQGLAAEKAIRIGKHMSYQLLVKNPDWEEGMDKLLLSLPIVGCMFKKTYYDPIKEYNCSDIVFPKNLVVNYYATSLETAIRITHVMVLSQNEVKEKQMSGVYRDVDLGSASVVDQDFLDTINKRMGVTDTTTAQEDLPRILLEQHCFLDLDDDGYKEPYIVVVDAVSRKVLRIVARYSEEGIEVNEDQTLRRIIPEHYFTKFSFIPNPDGSFYDIGFGILLSPINNTVNTLINQLIDAGTLSNLQAGFLSRQVKIKGGDNMFRPGEWKVINSSADDIKKGVFPMPVREPSGVLFQLLELMIQAGREISSVSEMMVGGIPGQNTKATVAVQSVEQGMKIFNSIYKRIYRSLGKEYKKMFVLNAKHLPPTEEFHVLGLDTGGVITVDDYRDVNIDVIPGADPQVATEEQRMAKSQALMQLLPTGLINPQEAIKRILTAQNQPGIEKLTEVQPPQPDPEITLKQQEQQWKQQKESAELELKAQAQQYDNALKEANAMLSLYKAQTEQQSAQIAQFQTMFEAFQGLLQHQSQNEQQSFDNDMSMLDRHTAQMNAQLDRDQRDTHKQLDITSAERKQQNAPTDSND